MSTTSLDDSIKQHKKDKCLNFVDLIILKFVINFIQNYYSVYIMLSYSYFSYSSIQFKSNTHYNQSLNKQIFVSFYFLLSVLQLQCLHNDMKSVKVL